MVKEEKIHNLSRSGILHISNYFCNPHVNSMNGYKKFKYTIIKMKILLK
jgi:hypothetical protein